MANFEQMLSQMMAGVRSDSDWLVESQHRQGQEHEQRLAEMEVLLRRALDFVVDERRRFAGYAAPEKMPAAVERINRVLSSASEKAAVNSPEQQQRRVSHTASEREKA